jgi:hypothetical protein
MPPGSVLIMPDFVWQSPLWASMAVGGALRGTRSLIIFPSKDNQPSASAMPQSRSQECFARLIQSRLVLADQLADSGGLVQTGFYDPEMDVRDVRSRIHTAIAGMHKSQVLTELLRPQRTQEGAIAVTDSIFDSLGYVPAEVPADSERRPQLHLKAQLYISGAAWKVLRRVEGWDDVYSVYLRERVRQLTTNNEYVDPRLLQNALYEVLGPKLIDALGGRDEFRVGDDENILYLSVGSQNMDYRGFYLDGEVTYVATHWTAMNGFMDFVFMLGLCDWVDDLEGVAQHIGSYGWLQRHLSRWATPMM